VKVLKAVAKLLLFQFWVSVTKYHKKAIFHQTLEATTFTSKTFYHGNCYYARKLKVTATRLDSDDKERIQATNLPSCFCRSVMY